MLQFSDLMGVLNIVLGLGQLIEPIFETDRGSLSAALSVRGSVIASVGQILEKRGGWRQAVGVRRLALVWLGGGGVGM